MILTLPVLCSRTDSIFNSRSYIKIFEVIKMTTFRAKIKKDSIRIPSKIKNEDELLEGDIVNVDIEKTEE